MAQLKQWTFLASAARTASANGVGLRVDGFTRATIYLSVTAASGTSPTLDVKPQISFDNVLWFDVKVPPDITEALAIAQTAVVVADSITFDFAAAWLRVVATQAGTGDNFTYQVRADLMKQS